MSEYGQTHPIPVPLYAVTIHKVVAGGDIAAMEQALSEAEQQLKQYGDLSAAIEILKAEIAKLGATNRGPIIRPLYGRPIEDAIQSGDLDKMKAIAILRFVHRAPREHSGCSTVTSPTSTSRSPRSPSTRNRNRSIVATPPPTSR